ncbi:winged helix-turn-helix domain-containing protein [Escherichia marmotae]|uniref:winged helix-turn-helix domain-containing protein n=1 Tax=Escherichia marmotae TaxID=1499973 RepID=UPI003CF9D732
MNIDFNFDDESGVLMFGKRSTRLSPKEAALFSSLLHKHQSDSFLPRNELAQSVWGERWEVISNNNIQQLILQLRRKIDSVGGPVIIENIYKRGYKMTMYKSRLKKTKGGNLISRFFSLILTFI